MKIDERELVSGKYLEYKGKIVTSHDINEVI